MKTAIAIAPHLFSRTAIASLLSQSAQWNFTSCLILAIACCLLNCDRTP
ncbi:hypothetical protein [Pseudanabaena sp. PCC 6802]|nr:hypothetical protein [Pseudanabaena sp. PCC 6802]